MVDGFSGGMKSIKDLLVGTIKQMIAYALKNKIMLALGMGAFRPRPLLARRVVPQVRLLVVLAASSAALRGSAHLYSKVRRASLVQ
jgi:hypothetical protein